MTNADDLAWCEAATIAERVRAGTLSPVAAVERSLAAMARLDPVLNAFCTPTPDLALDTARALEKRQKAGEVLGPLAGVPVAIKDLVLTRGIRTASGSRLYADFVPEDDDIVVERLKAADAVIIGKTNVSEFGFGAFGHNPLFPTTRNPWNPDLTPGGSSAGSAAAVAAGICPIAIGSDGGGSVRVPAALCGLVGIKASMGRVPLWPGCRDERYPGVSSWESVEHIGPITRSVRDAALMLSVIAGPDMRDRLSIPCADIDWLKAPAASIAGSRIALCLDWNDCPVDPEVQRLVEAAALRFERELGCSVERVAAPIPDVVPMFRVLVALETDLTGLRALAKGREHELMPVVRDMLARAWTAEEFTDAVTTRKRVVNAIARFMTRYDLMLTPTLSTPAFPIDRPGPGSIAGRPVEDDGWTPFAFPANLTGQPAASVPCGFTTAGLPVGLQITGRHLGDRSVIAAAAAFERIAPWSGSRPPVSA